MGLGDWFRRKIASHEAGVVQAQVQSGGFGWVAKSVWTFFEGWRSWIVAVVLVYKTLCHDCAGSGYVTAIMSGLGWDSTVGAFDGKQAALGLAVTWALAAHLAKAVKQYRAGVPLQYVHTDEGALIAADAAGIKDLGPVVAKIKGA